MAKNTITTPIKDAVMADNSTLSSNEIKKRIDTAAASILPEVSGSDEGKVLTVGSDGSWEALTPSGSESNVIIVEMVDNAIPVSEFPKFLAVLNDPNKILKIRMKRTASGFLPNNDYNDVVDVALNAFANEYNITFRFIHFEHLTTKLAVYTVDGSITPWMDATIQVSTKYITFDT